MNRAGGVKIGLLFVIIVLAAAAYYGNEIGSVYWRKYRIEDAVAQQLADAGQITDDGIRQGILTEVDRMGLPREARRFTLVRTERPRTLQFSMAYSETVNLLFTTKQISVSLKSSRRF